MFVGKTWATARIAGLFALLVLVFFSPALFNKQVLAPPRDAFSYYYPMRVYAAEVVSRGHLPLWNPLIFSGFPLLADIEVGIFYPPNWLFLILPAPLAMNLVVLSSYLLAGLFTYLYARAIQITRFGGLVAGLIFMFSGFMIAHLEYTSIINAACWFPLLLFFLERMRHRFAWHYLIGGALTLALQIFGSHPQIFVYSLMAAGLYVMFFGLADRPPGGRTKYLLGCAATVFGGLVLAACQILPTLELASHSIREEISYNIFTEGSLPLSHLLLFIFPYLFGGPSTGPYIPWWGRWRLNEVSGYVGMVPLILALAVLPLARRVRHVLFWLLLAALGLLLVLGGTTPLYQIMYYLPGYNSFRMPARNLMEVNFALAILSGLGLTHLSRLYRSLPLAASLLFTFILGLGVLFRQVGSGLVEYVNPFSLRQVPPEAFHLTNPAIFLPILLALVSGVGLLGFLRWQGRVAKSLVLLILFFDLCSFGEFFYWRSSSPKVETLQRHPLAVRSLKETDPEIGSYRFLSHSSNWLREEDYFAINEPNSSTLRGVANASGSSGLMLARYGEIVGGMEPSGAISDPSILHQGRALDLLNVRYLFVPDRLLSSEPKVNIRGVGFPRENLEIRLSRNRPDRVDLLLPPLSCSAIAIASLSVGKFVPHGHPLIRMTVWTKDGQRIERVLYAGWDTPEWAEEPPWSRARLKRWLVELGRSLLGKERAYEYRSLGELGGRQQIEKICFDYLASPDVLRITKLVFYDAKTQRSLRIPGDMDKRVVRLSPPPQRLEVAAPSVPCSDVILTSALSESEGVKQGQPVAKVLVWTKEGEVIERFLRAGEDTSEWAWERPDVRERVQHQKAPVAESFAIDGGSYQGHHYLSRLELGGSYHVEKIALAYMAPTASLHIFALSLSDPKTGTSFPLSLEGSTLQAEPAKPAALQQAEFTLPPVRCSAIKLVSFLENSTFVSQGQPVARVSVWTEEGEVIERLLRAGEDTSEWAWERPDLRKRVRHQKAPVAESFSVDEDPPYQGHHYLSRLELGGSYHVERVQVAYIAPMASLTIDKISFYDAETRHSLSPRDVSIILVNAETVDQVDFSLPSVPCSAIAVISTLGHSLLLAQGQPVAKVSVWTTEGKVIERLLRAGEDTSEWAWERSDVQTRVKHKQARIAQSFPVDGGRYQGHWYISQVDLAGHYQVERIKIAMVTPDATLSLANISFYDKSTGVSIPFSPVQAYLSDKAQWRRRLAVEGVTVYENLKALPRTWLVPRVRNLLARDILQTVRTGTLPDGTVFEPRHLALVEDVPDLDFGPLDPAAEVKVVDYQPSRLTVRSQCRTASFLVLSEIAYPGWQATIDGEPASIVRSNYVLRGVVLPAGTHRIDFVYRPLSFRLGVAISGTTLFVFLLIFLAGRGRGGER
jgi:hypothetical protein